jgi:hypothetical protein
VTNQETTSQNFFQTALTATVGATDLSFPVSSLGLLTTPCWLIVDPDSVTNREVILFDGVFGPSTFVTSGLGQRDQAGTASGGAKEHAIGVKVESRPLKQHVEDLNDRVDAADTDIATYSNHDNLTGLADDDHTQYLNTTRHDVTTRHPVSVLGSDGLGLGLREVVSFTSSGTFDKGDYPWLRHVRVMCVGAGGAGGRSELTGSGEGAAGGGGGSGGMSRSLIAVAALSSSETVTVGVGGAASTGSSAAGTDSSFGTLVVAEGGSQGGTTGGVVAGATAGGTGGLASAATGDEKYDGSDGGFAWTRGDDIAVSGYGAPSFLGGGPEGGVAGASISATSGGNTGRAPGNGGSGRAARQSLSAAAGGAGSGGIVIAELYG